MSAFLYNTGLWFYKLLISLAAWVNPKASLFINGRKAVWKSLNEQLTDNKLPIMWVHCSSVGEYEQGRPVMEAYKKVYPETRILVTFYSPSGFEAVQTDIVVDFKSFLPFDTRKNAKNFINLVKPELAIFVKYEFWYHYLDELNKNTIPVYSVSSIFRPTQLFFKPYGRFYRKMLNSFTFFFVQDNRSSELLASLNLPNMVTGDTRLDRVLEIRNSNKTFPIVESFINGSDVMVIGSMRREDIEIVIDIVLQYSELKFIIAPHEITESMIRPLEDKLDSTIRFSQADRSLVTEQVLIIDNIGMLSTIYRYANYTYVGGGFSDGIHNILEPAVFEIPVFFGNRDYKRFKEAIDLQEAGAAFPIGSISEFQKEFNRIRSDKALLISIKDSISQYLEINKGASGKIIKKIKSLDR